MSMKPVARTGDIPEGGKTLLSVDGQGIGLFKLDRQFHVWRNTCPHQGGPVCQGQIFKHLVERIEADRQVHERAYDDKHTHIVCPCHGAKFDIRTGRHAGTHVMALAPVPFEVRGGEIDVDVD